MSNSHLKAILSLQEQRALDEFRQKLKERYGDNIVSLSLFGSRSRGESNEFSDVDVLITVARRTSHMRMEIFDLAYDVFFATEINISPLIMTKEEFNDLAARERSLAKAIQQDGITI